MSGPAEPDLPEWATALLAVIVEPSLGQKQIGWATDELPPAEFFNWWKNNVFKHLRHLQSMQIQSLRPIREIQLGSGATMGDVGAVHVGRGRFAELTTPGSGDRFNHGRRQLVDGSPAAAPFSEAVVIVGGNPSAEIVSSIDGILGPYVNRAYLGGGDGVGVVWGDLAAQRWAAVFSNGDIAHSTDGETWTNIPIVASAGLQAVTTGVNLLQTSVRYCAVGAADGTDAEIFSSTNGTGWSEESNPKNLLLSGVAYDFALNLWVAVGTHDAALAQPGPYIITAPDLTTPGSAVWTQQTPPSNVETVGGQGLNAVAASDTGVFVAVGTRDAGAGGLDVPMLLRSTNGTTWTRITDPPMELLGSLNDVAFIGGRFVAVGEAGPGAANFERTILLSSFDGLVWESHEVPTDMFDRAGAFDRLNSLKAVGGSDRGIVAAGTLDAASPQDGFLISSLL